MGWKKVQDLSATSTVSFENKGQTVTGYYLGAKTVKADYGVSKLHIFKTDKENVGVWGSAKLDEMLAAVASGQMTQITYLGKVKLGGGRTLKKFDVAIDEGNTIDVVMPAGGAGSDSEDSDEYVEEGSGSGEFIDDEDEAEDRTASILSGKN